jgi:uncharacterized membrane protein YgcG
MKSIITIILLSTLSLVLNAQMYQSKWLDTELEIDGSNSDWAKRPEMFNKDTKMLYAIRNDKKFLYLIYELPEKETQQKFMLAGMQIDIQVKAKPKVKASITFPVLERKRPTNTEEIKDMQKGGNIDVPQKYLLVADNAQIKGFIKTSGMISRNTGSDDQFTYGIGWNEKQNMILELRIPLAELFGDDYKLENICESKIKVSNTLKAFELPSMGEDDQQGRSPMGGGNSMGGSSMGGGSRPSGGQGGGMHSGGDRQSGSDRSGMQSMFEEKSFKVKFVLVGE